MISITVTDELASIAMTNDRLSLERREYSGIADIGNADVVIAATDSVDVNSRIANDSKQLHRLVSVVNDPYQGTFTSMAIHRAESMTIGVSGGRAPREAVRIRNAIAKRFDELSGGST